MPPHQERPGELEHSRDRHRSPERERAGADRGAHGVGDIVGPDRPGHVEPEDECAYDRELVASHAASLQPVVRQSKLD